MNKDLSIAMAVARMRKAKSQPINETEDLDIASEIIKRRKDKIAPTEDIDFDTLDDFEMSDAGEVTPEDPKELRRKRLESLFNEPTEE